jgi:UDP-3-O-[3-hydroxymyristoyl] N-acetylglucosamine deacetylase
MNSQAQTSRTILVVDDDERVRCSVGDVLRDEGFRVLTATDGYEAVQAVEAERPDLVLLDVWMPELDGIEVLSRIRESRADLPVVIVSGHGNVETAVKATRLGAVDFIEKPFSIEALLECIHRALDVSLADGSESRAAQTAPRFSANASESGPRVIQRTLSRSVVSGGLGLHSGVRTGLILHPAAPGSGVRFGKVGGEGEIEALVDNVDSTGYATTLFKRGLVARTVEHLMAVLHAYGITNLLVKVEGEVPILDGSAVELCALIDSVGVEEQGEELSAVSVEEPIRLESGPDQFISISPYDGFRVTYELAYPEPVGEQIYTFEMTGPESFKREIAPARTFGFVEEIRELESAGLGQGGQLGNFILIGDQGIVNTELRFPEELARHKILDIIGDTYLLGAPVRGAIHARKTGHSNNVELMREIQRRLSSDGS